MSETHLHNLAQDIAGGRVVLFIGSGFSLNAEPRRSGPGRSFKDWAGLVERMATDIWPDRSKQSENLSYPEIIQRYDNAFGKHRRNEIIRASVPTHEYTPGALHTAWLDKSEWDWPAIITTNIDDLIEQTYRGAMQACTPVVRPGDFPRI